MNITFTYSVLKYVHSQFLGEELNLGIVLFFPNKRSLIFRYPQNIERFKKAYRNFTEPAIKPYLRSFEQKAKDLSEEKISGKLEDILQVHFLARDASTLQFGEIQSVVQYTDNIQAISDHYFTLYFPDESTAVKHPSYEVEHIRPISDHQITADFKNLIFAKNDNLRQYIKKGIELRNARSHFRSDLVWENGTVNAVKGLSFDLKGEEAILDKSVLITAQLNYLKDEAEKRNIRFDLLISPPSRLDLVPAYENALQTLSDIGANKKIVTKNELPEYVSFTSLEIERRPNRLQ